MVEEKTIDSKKVGSLLILSCKKLLLDLGKYIYRFKIGFGSASKGKKIILDVSQMAEESLFGSMKDRYWLSGAYRIY